jgi:hypothetical protein
MILFTGATRVSWPWVTWTRSTTPGSLTESTAISSQSVLRKYRYEDETLECIVQRGSVQGAARLK